jgi:hypothetical protein
LPTHDLNADPSYGAAFTPDMVTLPERPLYGQVPGGITRWMAVPWQADTASCRSGYPSQPPVYAPHLPTFWPARVPNQVLSAANYNIVMSGNSLDERLKAFASRSDWLAPIMHGSYLDQINSFIGNISQMGLVEMREGPTNDPAFPAMIGVQDVPPTPLIVAAEPAPAEAASEEEDLSRIDKVRRFPFGLKTLV